MSNDAEATVACPTCKRTVPWVAEQRYRPFCSERCKLIDLGDWATEAHNIPGESAATDLNFDESEGLNS